MTVSNVVSPLMVYVDRFLIGSILSIAAVAYYATPYEVATKLWIVPTALVGVMFPAFSTAMVADRTRGAMLYRRAAKYAGVFLFPAGFVLIVFAQDLLQIWLGHEFAMHSTRVLQMLGLGVFTSGLAYVPFALIQGAGRPDITGKLHLVELPFYLTMVWYLTVHYGIIGTALAWLLRVTVDAILLFFLADKLMGTPQGVLWPVVGIVGGTGVVVAIAPLLVGLESRLFLAVSVLSIFGVAVWRLLLSTEERFALNRAIRGAAFWSN
jgi:O-antigen/teichoic acid export membrane protein